VQKFIKSEFTKFEMSFIGYDFVDSVMQNSI